MELLCQYTKFESALKIFENLSLKLGRIADSNDPAEIKKLHITNECDISYRDKINNQINNYLDKILKMTCFSFGKHIFDYSSNIIDDEYGRPPFYKPRMWALYGGLNGDCSGICIIFNKERLQKRFSQLNDSYKWIFKKIKYSNFLDLNTICEITQDTEIELSSNKEIAVQNYLIKNAKSTFCQKDIDWRDEEEYRLLCWNKLSNKNFSDTFVYFDKEDVEAVILGYSIYKNKNYKDLITRLFSKRIPVYKMGLVENRPALKEIFDLNDDELLTTTMEIYHDQMNEQRKLY